MRIRQDNFNITAELPQDLTAGSAWRGKLVRIGNDRDAAEIARPIGDSFEHRHALGADRQAVGRVFDVAAGVDLASRIFKRGAHANIRKRGVSSLARLQSGLDDSGVAES